MLVVTVRLRVVAFGEPARHRPQPEVPMRMRLVGLAIILVVSLVLPPLAAEAQPATPLGPLSFENADIQTVIKYVGRLSGIAFLFDPEQVKGKITLLSPKSVLPAEALELLKSALALHGYSLLSRAEGMWIVPTVQGCHEVMIIKVVPASSGG